jgi:ribosomal protein S6
VNMYEAMIIFPEALKDEALEAAMEQVRTEIVKTGGRVESATRLGRRNFCLLYTSPSPRDRG